MKAEHIVKQCAALLCVSDTQLAQERDAVEVLLYAAAWYAHSCSEKITIARMCSFLTECSYHNKTLFLERLAAMPVEELVMVRLSLGFFDEADFQALLEQLIKRLRQRLDAGPNRYFTYIETRLNAPEAWRVS